MEEKIIEMQRKPLYTETIRRFTDRSTEISYSPEATPAPKQLWKETETRFYAEPEPLIDRDTAIGIAVVAVVVAVGVAAYFIIKDEYESAPMPETEAISQ